MDKKLSEIQNRFLQDAKVQKRKIAIGICHPNEQIVSSLQLASVYADVVVVGSSIEGFDCIFTEDDEDASRILIDLLKNKKIDGLVRAQLKDSFTHKLFCKQFGIKESPKNEPCFLSDGNYWFAVTNASNYDSLDAAHQKIEAERAVEYFRKDLGFEPKIAVMSTRRPSGMVDQYELVEKIAQNSEKTAQYLRECGCDVKEYYIEYERAVWERRNLLVASIGMVANTWIKGLCYLGGWKLLHLPSLDKQVYYDNSPRNSDDYFWPIISTVARINRGNNRLNS